MRTGQMIKPEKWIQKKHLIEGVILLLTFFCTLFFLARNAGGPVNSDNLFYMDSGLNGIKSIHTLFYYFHIFLQRLFMDIAPTPLGGVRLFWAFLVSSSVVLIYLSVRNLGFRNSRLNALLGVLFLFSMGFLPAYSGKTENDLTAMFLVSLILFVYLLSLKGGFEKPLIIGLLGFLIFLASRTKETAFMFSFIIIGFGFSNGDNFRFRELFRRLPAFLIGLGCGVVFFLILNSLILRDPFWGFRPSEIQQYLTAVENHARWGDISKNYFNDVVFKSMLFPFLLFFIAGVQTRDTSVPFRDRLPWFYPFVLILFFTVLMVFSSGYKVQITDRLFFPAIPVICVFASQVIDFRILQTRKDWIWLAGTTAAGLLIATLVIDVFFATQKITFYSIDDFSLNILLPIFVSIFIITYFWKNPDRIARLLLPVLCLSVILFTSLYQNYYSFFIEQPVKQRMEQIFYPFSVFANRIKFDPGMKFLVSSNINKEYQMLLRREDELRSIFNVYFRADASIDNFINQIRYTSTTQNLQYEDPLPGIEKMDYDYGLITSSDWERIRKIHGLSDQLLVKYNLFFDDQKSIALLVNKLRDDPLQNNP